MDGPSLLRREFARRVTGKPRLTQTAFAAKSGVPQCQLSLYLSGKRRPGYENRIAIQRATAGRVPASSWSRRSAASSAK